MAVKKQSAKAAEKPAAKASDKKADNKTASTKQAKTEEKKTPEKSGNKKTAAKKKKMPVQAKAIIMFFAAAILLVLVLFPGKNLWTMAHDLLKGLFGLARILLPAILIYLGVITAMEKQINGKIAYNLFFSLNAVLLISCCVFLFGCSEELLTSDYFACLGSLFINGINDYSNGAGAGVFGGILGYPLAFLFGREIAEFLCIITLVVDIFFLCGLTIKDLAENFNKLASAIKKQVNKKTAESKEKTKKNGLAVADKSNDGLQQETDAQDDDISSEAIDITGVSTGVNAIKQAKEGKKTKSLTYNEGVSSGDISSSSGSKSKLLEAVQRMNGTQNNKKQSGGILDKVSINSEQKGGKKKELQQAQEEITRLVSESSQQVSEGGYHYPPSDLLYPSSSAENTQRAMEELERNGSKLETTLQSFGVNANIINICRGPSVTRFEVQPAPGVKISKITNLADDIALNLASSGVRIEAPIPGKAAVGIEVPNKVVTMVSMRELIDSPEFITAKSKLSVVLGKDISGNTIVTDLAKMPHLLIAGTTGSGKSVCVNSILISLLYKATPDEVKLLLIDPKMVEFSKYKGIPHLLIDVVIDPKKAAGALNWAVNEMENRYRTFSAFGVRDIAGYNAMVDSYNKIRAEKTEEELEAQPIVNSDGIPVPDKRMFSIVIAIDEFADLMMTAPTEVEDSICRLAQKARAAGMHLVVATQRPTVNVITGVIKSNIPSRISLKVSSQLDSRTILDVGGAEKLIGRGDMLFAPIGAAKPMRVQGCYASDAEIENVTSYVKKDHTSNYDMEIQEEIEKITEQELTKGKDSDSSSSSGAVSDDEMMEEAIKLVVENGQASTSLLQRRLRLGYARAGRLIDEMEQMGIVGPHVGSKSREVLLSYQQWLERKNNVSK